MASEEASPSPSMHTARDTDTPAGSEGVLGRVVEVPPQNLNTQRALNFISQIGTPSTNHEDDSASLQPRSPQYLLSTCSKKAVLDMEAVTTEAKEEGDGDSVAEAEKTDVLMEAAMEAAHYRLKVLVKMEDDTDEVVLDNEANQVRFDLENLDADTKIPLPPNDWKPKTFDASMKVPNFKDVDNPGKWNEFTFAPKIIKKGKDKEYSHHALPTGCQVVPKGEDGKRVVKDWEFHYDDWKADDSSPHGDY